MNPSFIVRVEQDALIVSFSAPARTLSWAVVNGGFCHADHVINHHVSGSDRLFCARPKRWLEEAASRLRLQGTVVAMATAVEMNNVVQAPLSAGNAEVNCFATVGCGNALSVGDPAFVTMEEAAPSPLHTINLILTVQPGLSDEAMVEAVQIVTEGRVRALYEADIGSSVSSLAATGNGNRLYCRRVFGPRTRGLLRQAYSPRGIDRSGGICRREKRTGASIEEERRGPGREL